MNGNDTVQLADYLRAVRRRWWLVALLTILTTGAALAYSLTAEKQYDATAELLLRDEEPVNSLLTPGADLSPADPERELTTNVELIEVAATAHAAQRLLNIDRSADALLRQVETETTETSNIVDITARDEDPLLAARIANAFAEAYVAFRAESARQRYTEAAQLAERQLQARTPEELVSPEGRELAARQDELEVAAVLQTAGAQIVRRASPPRSPARPRPVLSGGLGLALGLMLGIAAALAREVFDRRLKSEESVEGFFELPILASIPRPTRRGADDHAQREAYGLLAANLAFTSLKRQSSVVMVTSASPGEGKTTVTLGLGRALARLGKRVIAIEADLRRPTFSNWASAGSSGGFSEVLMGSSLAAEVVWLDVETLEPVRAEATDGSAFAILPAGELPENPQRTLARPTVQAVIEGCRSIADVVVIDTAPIGTVNDAATLVPHVDTIALVVRLEQTTKDAARRAQRVLHNANVDLPGIVLTGAGSAHGYGYYGPAAPVTAGHAGVDDERSFPGDPRRSRVEGERVSRMQGERP